jgi:membrane fusion protein, heavy metal efflux system
MKKLQSQRTGNRFNGFAGLCFAVFVLAATGCHKQKNSPEPLAVRVEQNQVIVEPGSPPASSVSLETAQPPAAVTLALNGRIVWDDNVTTRLFTPFAGRVTKIHVEAGGRVEASAPLVTIASPDFGQAQADARRAATDFSQAERTAARLRELSEHGAAPQKDWQAAEADLDRARLEKQRTAGRLALYSAAADVDQAYVLKSPIAGVVVEKNIYPGAELRSDQMLANTPQLAAPLFVITDPTRLWIQIDVPERDQRRVHEGQTFVINSASLPGQSFTGRVDVVSAGLDPSTRTLKVRGSLANADRRLKGETFVKAEFSLPPERGAEVSSHAVFLRGEKHCVLVEEAPGRFARREVIVGSEHGGRSIIIRGLESGQRVVVDGAMLLEQMLESAPST